MLVEDLDAQGDGKNLQANWQDMGGLRAEEKWRLDRTGTSEGWLAVGGVPTPEGTLMGSDQRECGNVFPCPISLGSLPSSQARSYALRGCLQAVWPWGHKREDSGEHDRQVRGALQDKRSGRVAECICPANSGPGSLLGSHAGSPNL